MRQRVASRRVDLWLAATIVVAQVVLLAIETVVGEQGRAHAPFSDSSLAADLVGDAGILVWAVTGLVVVARRQGNRLGWLFLVANLGWVLGNSATAVAAYSIVVSPLPGTDAALWLATWPGQTSIAVYVLIVLLFPDGRAISPRWRGLAWFTAAFGLAGSALAAFAAGPIQSLELEGVPARNPLGIGGGVGEVMGALVSGPVQLGPVILFIAATVSLVLRFRRSTGLERLQLKWLVAAVLATTALWVSIVPFMFAYESLTTAPTVVRLWDLVAVNGSAVIPVAAAVAILRHRLYDIDRLVSRTVAWAAVTAVLALVFSSAVVGLDDLLAGVTQGQTLAVAASTLVAFALFQPVRRRIQAAVDHRFDRARYDAQRIVDSFAEGLRGQVDLDQIHDGVLTAVAGTVRPRAEAIWLRERQR